MVNEIEKLMQRATEILELGERMQQTFGGSDEAKRQLMIVAIAAGLKDKSSLISVDHNGDFGTWVYETRNRLGYTLRQIEDATGISNAYLSQLENGKIKKPSHDTVVKLTNFLAGNTPADTPNPLDILTHGHGLKGL